MDAVTAPREATLAVSIATHNRLDDLRRTLEALAKLTPRPDEIWVCADGCSDGTGDMVRREFPDVHLIESNDNLGSVGARDRILRSTTADLVLSLDDDSYPVEPGFIAAVKRLFERGPSLGIAYFPQRSDEFPQSLTQEDFGPDRWIASFANSGAVIRRSLYLQLAGYPTFFFHAYEEPDYALQVWASDHKVLYHTALTIRHHYTGVQRNEMRTHQRHARNECWSVLIRCPYPWMPFVALYKALSQLGYAVKRGPSWVLHEPNWWKQALLGAPRALSVRRPVPWRHYLAWVRLAKGGQVVRGEE